MKRDGILYLSHTQTREVGLSMSEALDGLEKMYAEKGRGNVEMPPKPGIHTRPDALIHAMPAYVPALGAAGIKWVSAYPENPSKGLPQVSGLIILNHEETGLPYCVMDCREVTAIRTGAKNALAAKWLARPDASKAGIIGCGIQGRSALEALACRFELSEVHVYDTDRERAQRYVAEMAQRLRLNILVETEPRGACEGMDIIVTAGPIRKQPSPTIENEWLAPGALASPVDFDSYWKPEAITGVDLFASDDVDQLLYYQTMGYFKTLPPAERIIDLGELAAGLKNGRQSETQRAMVMNLGLGLDDMAIAPLIYRKALEMDLGIWLET